MKKLICLVIIAAITFMYGCQIPVDKITEDGTNLNELDVDKDILDSKDTADTTDATGTKDLSTDENPLDSEGKVHGQENAATSQMTTVTVYYRDSDNQLIPLTRKIVKEEGIAKAALRSMVDSDLNNDAIKPFGLYTVLPEGTAILGMNIKEGTAIIDFNDRLLDYKDKISENNIIGGIVYCLTEFKTVNGVKILIDGKGKNKLKYGTDISGVLNRENVLVNSAKANLAEKVKKVDIYLYKYINEKYEYILPVSIEYIGVPEEKLAGEIIRMLASKSGNEKLYSQLPSKVELLESRIEDNVLVLDFNKEIKNYGGNAREAGILNQIMYTMKQIEGIDRVKILIEGKKDNLPEGTDVSREILIPAEINIQNGL